MGGFAALLVVLGIIGLIYGAMQKFKSGRLSKAPFVKTGDASNQGASVAGEKGAISVEGNVACTAPLTSPVTHTPCLYYELKVIGTWKDGDSNKSKDYVDEKEAAKFTVDDGSGAVAIDASKGGDFDGLEKTFDKTKSEGFFADLKGAVGKGEPIMFENYAFANPPMSKADKFQCIEKVVKVPPKLYVLGKSEGASIISPNWTSLILSNKSRDELMGSTAKAAKNFLIGGGAVLAVGIILGIISSVMAPKEAPVDVANVPAEVSDTAGDMAKDVGDEAAPADDAVADTAGPADEPVAAAEPSALCGQAMRCCEVLSGSGAAACAALAGAPEATCKTSLASFKKSVKKVKPKKLKECN